MMDLLVILLSVISGILVLGIFTIIIAIKKIDHMYKELEELRDLEEEDDEDVL